VRTTPNLHTIATLEITQPKPRTKTINVVFWDTLLHQTQTHSYTANYQNWKIDVQDFQVDAQGNAYILIAYENEMQRRKTTEQLHYELIKCPKNAQKIARAHTQNLRLPFDELHLKINENAQKIVLAGFYYNVKSEVYDGTVYQNFGMDSLEHIGSYLVPFSQNLTSKFNQTFAENNSRLNDMSIRKIINRSDSGIVIIAEVNYKVAQNMSFAVNPAMGRELFYKHFGEIIILCTDKNNAMAWEQLIPKMQVCRDDAPFGSFFLLQKPDRLCFFFNEDLDLKSPLYQIDITNGGTMQPKGVVAENFIGFFEGSKQISGKTMWIQGIKKREKGILQITQ
jgi:hypothetical protein